MIRNVCVLSLLGMMLMLQNYHVSADEGKEVDLLKGELR